MPNTKNLTVDGAIDVLGDLQTKADARFSQGGGIIFSTDNSNNISATKNGQTVNFPGGGSNLPLSVDNQGRLCITYEDSSS